MKPLTKLLVVVSLGIVLPAWMPALQRSGETPVIAGGPAVDGRTTTLLPDGRLLLLGGRDTHGVLDTAKIRDTRTGKETLLEARLARARAWHSASVLPDGTVLVLGGLTSGEVMAQSAELFDPAAGTFTALAPTGLVPRAHHSATVLSDGLVVIIGGTSADGETATSVELFDPVSRTSLVLSGLPKVDRRDHEATLLPDGRVNLAGGGTENGDSLEFTEIFDPQSRTIALAPRDPGESPDRLAPILEASLPEDGSSDVALVPTISLRFSEPLNVGTIDAQAIWLEGPSGRLSARVIGVESGRLAFIHPAQVLLPRIEYRLLMKGLADTSGQPLAQREIRFTTGEAATDDEDWIPDSRNLKGDWSSGRAESPWQALPALKAAPGVTAVAGQALALDGKPLANVTLSVDGASARTDHTGRFLLAGLSAGHHELVIDGRTASKPQRVYGVFEAGVEVRAGSTNVLPYTIWMPRIDTAHSVTIPYPTTGEVVITTPRIPGLELHLPPKTAVWDHDGNIVTQISITPIPVDRTPFPLPDGVYVPIYFTIQPGGAYVKVWGSSGPKGARLVYPNYKNEQAGTRLDFWHYEPDGEGWRVYGQGTVTPDARQVVPDPGVVVYEFTGAMISSSGNPPSLWPPPGNNSADGEPVDLSSGLFVMSKTDLFLPDILPIALTRTYRQNDNVSRPFGIGMTHPYAMFLWSTNLYQEADLILPDGGRIHYACVPTSTCTNNDIVMEHAATPTVFYKSRLTWNGSDWDLSLKDGTVYVFGKLAPLHTIHDRYGNTTTLTWSTVNGFGSPSGNLLRITSPNGRWIDFTYDASNRVTQAKDTLGRTVGYTYDAGGHMSTVTDPNGGVTTYTYYSGTDRMQTIKDPRNIVYLTNEYYSNGRVQKQTQADGSIFQFAYTEDGSGKVIQTNVTNPRGYVRIATFNASGYSLTDRYANAQTEQQTISYERQAGSNLITSVLDQLGRRIRFTYDTMGNPLTVTRLADTPSAVTTTLTYEPAFNQLASITDALQHAVSFSYDSLGSLTDVTDALQNQTTFESNPVGQIVAITDPLQNRTELTYEGSDLVDVKDPLGRIAHRFVDSAGRLAGLRDPQGRVTHYEYGPLNQLTKMTDPLGGVTSFTYDGNANLLTLTDARGKVTTYTYDNMDRLKTRKDPLLKTETYDYDLYSNVIKFTDRRGKVAAFQYDPLNRLTFAGFDAVTHGQNTTYESTITYGYDGGNRLRTVVDSLAGTITLTPDDLDHLQSEVSPQGTVSYTYDGADRVDTLTVAGQPTVTYDYDEANRLVQVSQAASVATLEYDDSNRRSAMTLPNGIRMEYGYDAASQLGTITYKLGANVLGDLDYDYDSSGLRTQVSGSYARTGLPAAVTSTQYNDANQLKGWGSANLNYDLNGNLTSDGTYSYTWDSRNQLTLLKQGQTTIGSFAYDGFGRRVSKTVSGASTGFLYDGVNIVQELSGATPTANLLTGLGIDEVFSRTDAAGTRSFLTAAPGSTLALADSTGTVQTQYTYEPFGKTTTSGATSSNAFQFTGRENDGAGLYFYRARFYSPTFQRFISEDPIGFRGGDVNLYAYARINPSCFNDPFGLASAWDVGWAWLLELRSSPVYYGPGDEVTQQLMRDEGVAQARAKYARGDKNYGQYKFGVVDYVRELLERDATGSFLGSYDVTIKPLPSGGRKFVVHNVSGWESGTRSPIPSAHNNLSIEDMLSGKGFTLSPRSILNSRPQSAWGPGGDLTQYYWWVEP